MESWQRVGAFPRVFTGKALLTQAKLWITPHTLISIVQSMNIKGNQIFFCTSALFSAIAATRSQAPTSPRSRCPSPLCNFIISSHPMGCSITPDPGQMGACNQGKGFLETQNTSSLIDIRSVALKTLKSVLTTPLFKGTLEKAKKNALKSMFQGI